MIEKGLMELCKASQDGRLLKQMDKAVRDDKVRIDKEKLNEIIKKADIDLDRQELISPIDWNYVMDKIREGIVHTIVEKVEKWIKR